MTDTVDILYSGTSIFIDFPLEGQEIPTTMTCEAKIISKDDIDVLVIAAPVNADKTAFELRIPYTATDMFTHVSNTLLVRVTDTATGYSDVIYEQKISWK